MGVNLFDVIYKRLLNFGLQSSQVLKKIGPFVLMFYLKQITNADEKGTITLEQLNSIKRPRVDF